MGVSYEIVVSSENSLYMAWQTLLFCSSAWTTLGRKPVVFVHGTNGELRSEFQLLRQHGYAVRSVPSFAMTPRGARYPPRNELGTLLQVSLATGLATEHILFCEPDMLFVRPLEYSGGLAAEFYSYLHYDERRVAKAAHSFGVNVEYLNQTKRVGVPYLIPLRHVTKLAARWIEVLDRFEDLQWIDIMYAFGIASAIEDLEVEVTHVMTDNCRPTRPVRSLIHYCCDDPVWSKCAFKHSTPFDVADARLEIGARGTVLGEIMRQIRGARLMFRQGNDKISQNGMALH